MMCHKVLATAALITVVCTLIAYLRIPYWGEFLDDPIGPPDHK